MDRQSNVDCRITDEFIYRYMPLERYWELIEDKTLTLTHLTYWEDPYEAFILRGGMQFQDPTDNRSKDLYEKFKNVFGQSWTRCGTESDVLWRAMGKGGETVRVKVRVDRLVELLSGAGMSGVSDASGTSAGSDVRIDRIVYKTQGEFSASLVDAVVQRAIDGTKDGLMDFFFMKRKEFSLEREVRILAIPDAERLNRKDCKNGSLLKFKNENVAIDDLVVEVVADPRMDRRVFERVVCRTLYASPRTEVRKSRLFDWPITRTRVTHVRYTVPREAEFEQHVCNLPRRSSTLAEVRAVFRMMEYASENVPPEGVLCQWLREEIDRKEPNKGCANTYKSSLRKYMRFFYGRDENGVVE